MARTVKTPDSIRPPPRVRRAYYDCRYGQLHLHNAIPSGGGFDELTSVHLRAWQRARRAGSSCRCWPALGLERSVYALDLPGMRRIRSAPRVDRRSMPPCMAVTDFVDSMRIRSFDLVARGDGCEVALRLLKLRGAGGAARGGAGSAAAGAPAPMLPHDSCWPALGLGRSRHNRNRPFGSGPASG